MHSRVLAAAPGGECGPGAESNVGTRSLRAQAQAGPRDRVWRSVRFFVAAQTFAVGETLMADQTMQEAS